MPRMGSKRLLIVSSHISSRGFNYRTRVFLPYLAKHFRILVVEFSQLSECLGHLRRGVIVSYSSFSGIPLIRFCSPLPHDTGQVFYTTLSYIVSKIAGIMESFKADYLLVSPLHLASVLLLEGIRGSITTVYEDVDRFYEFFRHPTRFLLQAYERVVLGRANIVVSVSPRLYLEASMLRPGKKTCFIPNGVEYQRLEKYYHVHRARANKILTSVCWKY